MTKQVLKQNWYKYLLIGILLGLSLTGCSVNQHRRVYRVTGPAQPQHAMAQAGASSGYNSSSAYGNVGYDQTAVQPSLVSMGLNPAQANSSTRRTSSDESRLNVYHIGPGDVLKVKINQLLQLGQEEVLTVEVDQAGRVILPVLNNVTVGGMTCAEARQSLRSRLSQEFIRDPRVTVEVSEYHSKKVMVFGSVGSEGSIALRSDIAALVTVIADAGGINDDHAEDVLVVRGGSERLGLVDGSLDINSLLASPNSDINYEVVRVPIVALLGDTGWQFNPLVYPGDVVYVPSIQNGTFYITGAVNRQGSMPLQRPMNILQGVVAAGNTTRVAANNKCHIIRTTPDGEEIVIDVNLDKVRSGEQENILLARNDVIVVPTDPFLAFLDAVDKLIQRGVHTGIDATYDTGATD